jgi:hypothetical protein
MKNIKFKNIMPLLLCIFFPISLLSNNIGEIKPSDSFRAILISILIGFCTIIFSRYLFVNENKRIVFSALVLFQFFSYGHFHLFLEMQASVLNNIARIRYLVPLNIILFLFLYI